MEEQGAFPVDPSESPGLPRVVFVITVRNAANWIAQCLHSVRRQRGDHWRAIVVDDASEDDTWRQMSEFAQEWPTSLTLQRTRTRRWKMFNFAHAMRECEPHEVIVELDGDDWLLRDDVATEIASLHRNFDAVWTQHTIDHGAFPDWDVWHSTSLPDRWTRHEPWRPSIWTRDMFPGHLRSFKRSLFDVVRDEDMRWNGEWIRSAADVAYFTPILEATAEPWKYHYARPCACYRITAANDFLKDRPHVGILPIESQGAVTTYLRTLPAVPRMEARVVAIPIHEPVEMDIIQEVVATLRRRMPLGRFCFGIPRGVELTPTVSALGRVYNVTDILQTRRPPLQYDARSSRSREIFTCAFVSLLLRRTRCDSLVVVNTLDLGGTSGFQQLPRNGSSYDELEIRLRRLLTRTEEVPP